MSKITIIAEGGVNHNGDRALALELVDAAAKAGADYVKFQTWKSESLVVKGAAKAGYQQAATGDSASMLDMLKKLELSFEDFKVIKDRCQKAGVGFMSSPFDVESAEFLYSLGVDTMKIASGEITNLPLLETLAGYPRPVLLSTGMSRIEEIEDALGVLRQKVPKEITLLLCNTQYPTPMRDVNLRAMQTLRDQFGIPVGLSDHSLGIEVPIAAAALGASVIEKHFTLSRSMKGPDHQASADPKAFEAMVRCVRNIELALGSGEKIVTGSERDNRVAARKSIVAARKIRQGEVFTTDNITTKRPGSGVSPMLWHDVLGVAAIRDFEADEPIALE